ncbi:hypothetical protein UY3_10808 [Chelonia mydas]|uniref:Uncharacterized protein n=1 Tax=Chelonia mydas TaxID=8469 RepID=M7BVA1_CHEMY|nr:hypothetical protein UY3_10808 [Chelonia mydas]
MVEASAFEKMDKLCTEFCRCMPSKKNSVQYSYPPNGPEEPVLSSSKELKSTNLELMSANICDVSENIEGNLQCEQDAWSGDE